MHKESVLWIVYIEIFVAHTLYIDMQLIFCEGFVAAHTLPVLYEKYDDQIDAIVYYILGQLQNKYRDFDASVLSRIPRREYNAKKYE